MTAATDRIAKADQPLVSVCIPSYNARDYIGDTIDSILRQGYAPLEIIVQDDCSTDGTWEVLQSLATRIPELTVFRNRRNLGVGRNCAGVAERARGEFMVVLSCDDQLEDGFLATAIPVLQQGEAEVVTGGFFIVTPDRTYARRMQLASGTFCRFAALILLRNPFNINFTLFNRRAIAGIGYGRHLFASLVTWDYDFWLRLGASGLRLRYIDQPLGRYRVHGSNVSFQTERFNRPTLLAILRHKEALRAGNSSIYRLTLLRFLGRMLTYAVKSRSLDRRLFAVVWRQLVRL